MDEVEKLISVVLDVVPLRYRGLFERALQAKGEKRREVGRLVAHYLAAVHAMELAQQVGDMRTAAEEARSIRDVIKQLQKEVEGMTKSRATSCRDCTWYPGRAEPPPCGQVYECPRCGKAYPECWIGEPEGGYEEKLCLDCWCSEMSEIIEKGGEK